MANSPSARKRIRQTIKRTYRHVARRSRARGYVRIFEEALYANTSKSAPDNKGKVKDKVKDGGDSSNDSSKPSSSKTLDEHFRTAMSELHRAAQRGALHRKAVSRKVSRLARDLVRQQAGTLEPKPEGRKSASKAKRTKASAKATSK